jgi:hypothetical protein
LRRRWCCFRSSPGGSPLDEPERSRGSGGAQGAGWRAGGGERRLVPQVGADRGRCERHLYEPSGGDRIRLTVVPRPSLFRSILPPSGWAKPSTNRSPSPESPRRGSSPWPSPATGHPKLRGRSLHRHRDRALCPARKSVLDRIHDELIHAQPELPDRSGIRRARHHCIDAPDQRHCSPRAGLAPCRSTP